ncbi:MAG: cell division protein FtsL [Salinisphaeraceae bacterium]|nr:cell division protein FtsL [Salinisphaeraceae bacterium]
MKSALLLAALLVVNLVAAVAVVGAKHESRSLRADLQSLRVERDELNTEWAQLQLEESAWANPDRIGRLASSKLEMSHPDEFIMLEAGQ